MGGAAALLTARWCGEAGIARPKRGTLPPDCDRPAPGMGGRRRGAGEAMSRRSGGSTVRRWDEDGSARAGQVSVEAVKEAQAPRQPYGDGRSCFDTPPLVLLAPLSSANSILKHSEWSLLAGGGSDAVQAQQPTHNKVASSHRNGSAALLGTPGSVVRCKLWGSFTCTQTSHGKAVVIRLPLIYLNQNFVLSQSGASELRGSQLVVRWADGGVTRQDGSDGLYAARHTTVVSTIGDGSLPAGKVC